MLVNALCYGGDRWFVYTLFIIFLLLIPIRTWLKKKWVSAILIAASIGVCSLGILPKLFALDKVFYNVVFFIVGYMLGDYFPIIKEWSLKYWYFIYVVFIVVNMVYVRPVARTIPFVFLYVLPFTGTLAVMTMAFQLEKVIEKSKVVQYIEYCGKYSLQFYLFTFCYPLIRWGIVMGLHITNPVVILTSVFVLQLITITIIVEITRRIKWLKIPCGY